MTVVSQTLTGTIDGVSTPIDVDVYGDNEPRDGHALLPPVAWRPVPWTPAEIAALTWEDIWVGPGWTTEPTAGREFATLELAKAGMAGLGITASDNLRIYGKAGTANAWDFAGVLDSNVGQQGAVVVDVFDVASVCAS